MPLLTSAIVSAVGVPPREVVDKLHKHGILYAVSLLPARSVRDRLILTIHLQNMIGHVKHVKKCLELGADIICAQGGEGGGHTVSSASPRSCLSC